MLSREMVLDSIREVGECEVSDIYGKDTVLKITLNPNYYLYTAISTIKPCFFHIAESVVAEMEKDKVDFAIAFIDGYEENVYVYDSKQASILLANASVEKKSKNYRLTSLDLRNPIGLSTFVEFIDSLQ